MNYKGKKIAVVGASYLQKPLVQKAKELGLEVHCFAWEKGAVCKDLADYFYPISTLDKEQILTVCQEIGINGICTIASDSATVSVNYVASKMGLVSNPYEITEHCTNKYMMRNCFIKGGVPSPKYTLVNVLGEYDISGMSFPLIVKPTDRSGSLGVEKVESIEVLKDAINRATRESFTHEAIVEEFITGREISVESISFKGKHYVLQITDKVTTEAPFFVELEHHQPSSLPLIIQDKIKQLVPDALDALQITSGASHAEIKITENNDIYFVEIGARMGGDFIGSNLVELSTGYDFVKGVIDVALGSFEEPNQTINKYSGVYFLSKETERIKPIIENWKNYPEIVEAEITDPELRNIECSGDRNGFFIYQSNKRFNV